MDSEAGSLEIFLHQFRVVGLEVYEYDKKHAVHVNETGETLPRTLFKNIVFYLSTNSLNYTE